MSSQFGIALGLTNLYLKRFAQKGYIKCVKVQSNRVKYSITLNRPFFNIPVNPIQTHAGVTLDALLVARLEESSRVGVKLEQPGISRDRVAPLRPRQAHPAGAAT
jgi:hypothetical protein